MSKLGLLSEGWNGSPQEGWDGNDISSEGWEV